MENIFKISKRGIIVILTLCILLGTTGISVHAISVSKENIATTEESTVVNEETTLELMPMMASGCCSIPQDAYSMYSYINSGYDTSIYTHHEYANVSAPFLPQDTTYITYYMAGLARLVIGADGSAYYTPDHYRSWMKIY